MKCKLLTLLIFTALLTDCSKNKDDDWKIYSTDNVGNQIGEFPQDNQWKNLGFSTYEMALFKDLDTANLTGTLMPSISNHYYATPNPFENQTFVYALLNSPLNGEIIVKYVVVNRNMTPVQKASVRIGVISSITFLVPGNFNRGTYRLYFTYSAEGHEHFYKSWGNIQKW